MKFTNGGMKLSDTFEIDLRGKNSILTLYIDVYGHGLSQKWLKYLKQNVEKSLHLEKNYCWLGWTESKRTAQYLCTQINNSIEHINASALDYRIECEPYHVDNVIQSDLDINHERMNWLHRYFEDLQGWAGGISDFYRAADPVTKWHIRQLNLLCHELESQVLSLRKAKQAPEWRRPSQLMCWLNAERFDLDREDFEHFGIETINRQLGGVYLGVNKAVGKHHWEVFNDEGRDSRVSELVTSGLRSQTQAAGDFDIEWARDPGAYHWQIIKLKDFREWLSHNGFDPNDKSLTIGHPKVAQVNLQRSFGTQNYQEIWHQLAHHLDVWAIRCNGQSAVYDYCWSDRDFIQRQVQELF